MSALKRCFASLPQAAASCARLKLPRDVVAITGPDSTKFLNGLLTIKPPDPLSSNSSAGVYAGMLNHKGRVVMDTFVYPVHGKRLAKDNVGCDSGFCYLLEVDSSILSKTLSLLSFHKLMSDIEIQKVPSLGVWYAWNDTQDTDLETHLNDTDAVGMHDPRVAGLGVRALLPEASDSGHQLKEFGPLVDEQVYQLRRYLAGVPEGAQEIVPEKALPLEYCMDYMHGIDFEKGCYVGQELTIRTYHHGTIRKRVVPVVFVKEGAEVSEEIYEPVTIDLKVGTNILDSNPAPGADEITQTFAAPSPFGSVPRAANRPAGTVVAVLGNVGLASMRLDKLGHQFSAGGYEVYPLDPYWWPEEQPTVN